MLHLKYTPKTVAECVVNNNIVNELPKYILNDSSNQICFVVGQPGSGKTVTTNLVLENLKKNLIEVNFSHKINKEYLHDKLTRTNNAVVVFEDSHLYESDLTAALIKAFKNRKIYKKVIIITYSEFATISYLDYKVFKTTITNKKTYKNFIASIAKSENFKVKKLTLYIEKCENNIRDCINNLSHPQSYNFYTDTNVESTIYKLAETNTFDYKNSIINNSISLQFAYFENIVSYSIDIATRLLFSEAMIFCDQLTTNAYTYQNWEIMNYIVYGACIKSSMILPVPSFPIVKSTTWSSFSNLCSKLNKINYIYLNQKFEFSLITIKFFRTTFIQLLNAETFGKEEIEKILKLLLQYNIATYQELENILNVGSIKKQTYKNLKVLKGKKLLK